MAQRIPYARNTRKVKLFSGTERDVVEADVNAFLASLPEATACTALIHFSTAISYANKGYLYSVAVDWEEGV